MKYKTISIKANNIINELINLTVKWYRKRKKIVQIFYRIIQFITTNVISKWTEDHVLANYIKRKNKRLNL